jgi:hypothetical protein
MNKFEIFKFATTKFLMLNDVVQNAISECCTEKCTPEMKEEVRERGGRSGGYLPMEWSPALLLGWGSWTGGGDGLCCRGGGAR